MSDTVTKKVDLQVGTPGAPESTKRISALGQALRDLNQAGRDSGLAGRSGLVGLLRGAGAAAIVKIGADSIRGIAEAYGEVAKGQLTVTEGFFKMASAIPILGSVVEAAEAVGKALRAANHPEDAANLAAIAGGKLRGEGFKSSYEALGALRREGIASRGDPFAKLRSDADAKYEEDEKKIDEMKQKRAEIVQRDFELRANMKKQQPAAQYAIEQAEMQRNAQAIEILDARIAESGRLSAEIRNRAWEAAGEKQIVGLTNLKNAFFETFDEAGKHVQETINAASVASLRERIKLQVGLLGNYLPGIGRSIDESFHAYLRRQKGSPVGEMPYGSGAPLSESRFLTGTGGTGRGENAWQETSKNTAETVKVLNNLPEQIGRAIAQFVGAIVQQAPKQ